MEVLFGQVVISNMLVLVAILEFSKSFAVMDFEIHFYHIEIWFFLLELLCDCLFFLRFCLFYIMLRS